MSRSCTPTLECLSTCHAGPAKQQDDKHPESFYDPDGVRFMSRQKEILLGKGFPSIILRYGSFQFRAQHCYGLVCGEALLGKGCACPAKRRIAAGLMVGGIHGASCGWVVCGRWVLLGRVNGVPLSLWNGARSSQRAAKLSRVATLVKLFSAVSCTAAVAADDSLSAMRQGCRADNLITMGHAWTYRCPEEAPT